jgi:hypothetical protein
MTSATAAVRCPSSIRPPTTWSATSPAWAARRASPSARARSGSLTTPAGWSRSIRRRSRSWLGDAWTSAPMGWSPLPMLSMWLTPTAVVCSRPIRRPPGSDGSPNCPLGPSRLRRGRLDLVELGRGLGWHDPGRPCAAHRPTHAQGRAGPAAGRQCSLGGLRVRECLGAGGHRVGGRAHRSCGLEPAQRLILGRRTAPSSSRAASWPRRTGSAQCLTTIRGR